MDPKATRERKKQNLLENKTKAKDSREQNNDD